MTLWPGLLCDIIVFDFRKYSHTRNYSTCVLLDYFSYCTQFYPMFHHAHDYINLSLQMWRWWTTGRANYLRNKLYQNIAAKRVPCIFLIDFHSVSRQKGRKLVSEILKNNYLSKCHWKTLKAECKLPGNWKILILSPEGLISRLQINSPHVQVTPWGVSWSWSTHPSNMWPWINSPLALGYLGWRGELILEH